jgi:putative ABC transport system permease protein
MSPIPHQPPEVTARRAGKPHTSMFIRMLVRAAVLRRGRAASALLAMIVASAVATAMLNLFTDVQAKLRKEFRNYGANIVVIARDGASLPTGSLAKVESALGARDVTVPFAYVVARTSDGEAIVVAGTDFERVRKLNSWWSVTKWPANTREALVGARAAAVVSPTGQAFDLSFRGRMLRLSAAGILRTGAAEDSRIYLDLPDFESWSGVTPSTIEVAATGSPDEVSATLQRMARAVPEAEVKPIRQVMEAEAHVLGKTRAALLASCSLIILTAALCVLSTLMGWVLDRRRDFAIMKALGASGRLLNGFFAAEAASLGVVGAVIGFLLGIGIAAWIGRVNFHAPVVPRFSVLPIVLLGSVAVSLLSAALPISILRRVEPAMILRGE